MEVPTVRGDSLQCSTRSDHKELDIAESLRMSTLDEKHSGYRRTEGPLPPPLPPEPPHGMKKRPVMIQVDGVDVTLRQSVDKIKRKAATKSGVTQEARKVLEQFLQKSYEKGFTSSELNTQSEREYLDESPYMLLQSNESYYGNGKGVEGANAGPGDIYFDEPDYAEPAEPDEEEEEFEQIPETQADIDAALGHERVMKTNSASSQSSFGLRSHPVSRNRSPSDRLFFSVLPQHVKGKVKAKVKKHHGLYDESSSSTEDYEYTESYLVSRKKKSFFKWASERLRQSFRRSHKVPVLIQGDIVSNKGPSLITVPIPEELDTKDKKDSKKNKLKFNLKRHGSDKGSKSTHSSSTPNEVAGDCLPVQEMAPLSEGEIMGYNLPEHSCHLERTGSSEPRRKSPVPWKRYEVKPKKKESLPREAGKEKGIFDSFLKHIRKGSAKFKKKSSKGDDVRQRSRSADNLVIRPLSKEHEKVLQRYTTHKDCEYDSDNTTVRSLHDVHRVVQPVPVSPKTGAVWYPPPLPPEPAHSEDGGLHSLRHDLHLEGLLSCHYEVDAIIPAEVDITVLNKLKSRRSASEDEVDGEKSPKKSKQKFWSQSLNVTDKPFHERTDREKEELYEKIAEQLAAIADHYNMESPRSSKSLSSHTSHSHTDSRSQSNSAPSHSEPEDIEQNTAVSAPTTSCSAQEQACHKELEEQLGMFLAGHQGAAQSDVIQDIPPFMAELVRNASYSKFKQLFNENIGNEPGWQQIAMMFRLTQTAVQLAGFGTAAALQIKEMTMTYFEDKFAGWIVGQGGWESVVEDTEADSELD